METIYKVVSRKYDKERNNRKKDREVYTKNVWIEESLFTSKSKAIDKARWYAEAIEFTARSYNSFELGITDFYYEKDITVLTYEESEGALICQEYHHFMETDRGDVLTYENVDKFFETF